MSFLSLREKITLIGASVCIVIMLASAYRLTGWHLDKLEGDVLVTMFGILTIMVPITGGIVWYGLKPRLDRFFKKYEPEPDFREHTEKLCNEVYEPLLRMFAGVSQTEPYTTEYKVLHTDERGERKPIRVEELQDFNRAMEHLASDKSYQGAHEAWEEAKRLRSEYNKTHQDLIQELKNLIVERMQKHLSAFHEHESTKSPLMQDYFHSEGLLNVIIREIKDLLNDPKLKVDFEREFKTVELLSNGNWCLLERMGNTLLRSRRRFTSVEERQLGQVVIDVEDNSKIREMVSKLVELHVDIKVRTLG
jgi:hypothetical protein